MRAHAALSPSDSHRWLNCAGAINATEGEKEKPSSVYAAEGTAAHSLLEMTFRLDCTPEEMIDVCIHRENNVEYFVTESMASAVGHAADYVNSYVVRNPKTVVYVEHQVRTGIFTKRGEVTGTSDIILDNWPIELVAVDYKHGAGIAVNVDKNTQLRIYLLGARHVSKRRYKRYRSVVIQPRMVHEAGPVRQEILTNAELDAFDAAVRKRAVLTDNPKAPRKAGSWCRWCGVAGQCKTLAEYSLATAEIRFKDAV